MVLMQLIYHSRPFGFDAPTLDAILLSARANNGRDGITGALVCRADLYIHLLEGPRQAVTDAFGRILRDERHLEVTLVWAGDALARAFPEWEMRDDPPRSWMWSQAEVGAGAQHRAGAAAYRRLFDRLRREEPMAAGG